jgi:DNA-binding transcriptional LysR family regulator
VLVAEFTQVHTGISVEVLVADSAQVARTLGDRQAVVAAVGQNLGVGFVSNNAVVNRGNKAVAVRIDGLSLERDLSLVYETERVRGRHTQAFIDFAKTKSSSPISSHQHSSMGERYRYAIELLQP